MKKVLSILTAFALGFALSVNALAITYEDYDHFNIKKTLTINNPDTVHPAETFYFTIGTGTGERDGVPIVTVPQFPEGNKYSILLPESSTSPHVVTSDDIPMLTYTELGVYTYPVTEIAGDTAGMDYDNGTYYLIVTVINNPAYAAGGTTDEFLRVLTMIDGNDIKADSFMNDFDAGDLSVEKIVTGNFGDQDDVFEITVKLTPKTIPGTEPAENYDINTDPIEIPTGGTIVKDAATGVVKIVFSITGGDTFTIENIPYDVTYTVEETNIVTGYKVTYDNDSTLKLISGEIDTPLEEHIITNHNNTDVNTGINLDSLPYVLLLAGAIVGLSVLFLKKRQNATF